MDTAKNQPTVEERQANLDKLILAWKERKQQVEAQSIALLRSAEGKIALQNLKAKDASR